MRILRSSAFVLAFGVFPLVAGAVSFRDVPSSYPHKEAIEKLSDRGVISGNPDGTFKPYDPVNRAAMLKMLYLAKNLSPSGDNSCFSDVPTGAWFTPYVCDAVKRGFVKGYQDGKFWPARPVSRSEALKLTIAVLGIPSAVVDIPYTDVKGDDWFREYVQTAVAVKILPMSGQTAPLLNPSWPMERGEAAAYIWAGLNASPAQEAVSSASSSAAQESSVSSTAPRASSSSSAQTVRGINVKLPFADSQTFINKHPFTYSFSVDAPVLFDAVVKLDGKSGGLVCRLYELGADGFSSKYYLGHQEGGNCYLRAYLTKSEYQLQLTPTMANLAYSLEVTTGGASDGNDGFAQAREIGIEKVRVESLDANDLADFFTFRVFPDGKVIADGGRKLTVGVISSPAAGCLVYPMADVDLYGFSGPECGKEYLYPVGTYVIAITHPGARASHVTYSLQVK